MQIHVLKEMKDKSFLHGRLSFFIGDYINWFSICYSENSALQLHRT